MSTKEIGNVLSQYMKPGCWVGINSMTHMTGTYMTEDRKYIYYDPNAEGGEVVCDTIWQLADAVIMALGPATNAPLHQIPISIDVFRRTDQTQKKFDYPDSKKIIQEFLKKRASQKSIPPLFGHKDYDIALFLAARDNHEDTIDALLLYAKEPDAQININKPFTGLFPTAFFAAVYFGHEEIVKKFLATKEAWLNVQNEKGDTPLIVAARNGFENIVAQLLANKIDLDAKNNVNETAFSAALKNGHYKIAKQLFDAGVDITPKNAEEETALITVIKKKQRRTG